MFFIGFLADIRDLLEHLSVPFTFFSFWNLRDCPITTLSVPLLFLWLPAHFSKMDFFISFPPSHGLPFNSSMVPLCQAKPPLIYRSLSFPISSRTPLVFFLISIAPAYIAAHNISVVSAATGDFSMIALKPLSVFIPSLAGAPPFSFL